MNEQFFLESDIYRLTVFWLQNKLSLKLEDFVDWNIYWNELNDGNLGDQVTFSEIHQTLFRCFEEKIKPTSDRWPLLDHYQYGEVVSFHGTPCYKIQPEGKLTVYLQTFIKNQPVIREVVFNLPRFIQPVPFVISRTKQLLRKKKKLGELSQTISHQLQQITNLQNKLNKQTTEQAKLVINLKEKKDQLDQYIKQKLAQHAQKANDKIKSYINVSLSSIPSKSIKSQQQKEIISKADKIINENTEKIAQMRGILQNILYSQRYLTLYQENYGRFKISSNLGVKFLGPDEQSTIFIINSPIFPKRNSKFRLKVLRSQQPKYPVMIGLLDYNKSKEKRNFNEKLGSEGLVYSAKFSQNDTVQFKVDRKNQSLIIFINSEKKIEQKTPQEKFEHIPYYPFVEMHQPGDTVQWVLTWTS